MEKQTQAQAHKPKNNFMKFLSKPAPFSPSRDKRSDHNKRVKPHAAKGFSGQIVSLIPDEARRRSKNSSFETQEPTSPKISCMGQIKHKKKITTTTTTTNHKSNNSDTPKQLESRIASTPQPQAKKRPSAIKKLLSGGLKPDHGRRRSDASVYDKQPLTDRAPPLSQLKRFASGRDTLADFDWSSSQIITPFGSDQRNYYSNSDEEDDEEEEEEIIIPFSAPMIVGAGMSLQPRKEVNLWKRRTMDPPRPLQLKL
ncbi:uncharacterized protein At1g76070 [Euphorbia lathyris]|uniref:uncharacterized protein At1g76070 n=1 Tax=Euphorbia lathyris TaxID=212925 RepID=UPI00331434AB